MLKNEGDRLTKVAVCSPRSEYFRIDNLRAHNIREVADRGLAGSQHAALCRLLAGRGVEVVDIGECPGHPNSVFTRDMAVGTPNGYIRASMGIPTRVGEDRWMAAALARLGEPCAGSIRLPGTLEGGDAILAGKAAFVGLTRRTDAEGIRQVSVLFDQMGVKVRVVELPENFLHLDQTVGILSPERLIVCGTIFDRGLFQG